MIIPKTFISQTLRTADTGARPLTVQADANAMAAPGRALAALGEEGVNAGVKWMANEIKIRRATDVTTTETAYKSAMFEHENVASAMNDPEKAKVYIAEKSQIEQQRLKKTTGSFDSVTKRRIGTVYATEDSLITSRVRNEARKRMVSEHIASSLNSIEQIKTKLATASIADQIILSQKVLGKPADALKNTPATTGIIDNLVDLGYLNAEQGQKAAQNFRQDVDENAVDQRILEVTQSGDPGQADKLSVDLANPANFSFLSASRRTALQEQVLKLSDRLARRSIATIDKQTARDEKNAKKAQVTLELSFHKKIAAHRMDSENILPDENQILKAYVEGRITEAGYKRVIDGIENIDKPIINDMKFVRDAYKDIFNAETQLALDDVLKETQTKFIDGKIDTVTLQNIENRIAGRKNNTEESQQIQSFTKVLNSYLKSEGILDGLVPGSSERASIVIDQFNSDIRDNTPVLKAFENAFDSINKLDSIDKLVRPRYGPTKPLKDWTLKDVEASVSDTRQAYSGKASTLASQMAQLILLRKYIEGKPEKPPTPLTPEQLEAKEEKDKAERDKNRL